MAQVTLTGPQRTEMAVCVPTHGFFSLLTRRSVCRHTVAPEAGVPLT